MYEYTGGLSLVATTLTGREPDAVMADYRNSYLPEMKDAKQAVAVEMRAVLLNPTVIKERMKGDATTASSFGEMFRNIFGWSVMRPSALNENTYDDLYETYIDDIHELGIKDYFDRVNPTAFQEMTATMLEAARKGYWKASDMQLSNTAALHAELTETNGAPCTEFVCGNDKLQFFIASKLKDQSAGKNYLNAMATATGSGSDGIKMKREDKSLIKELQDKKNIVPIVIILTVIAIIFSAIIIHKRKNTDKSLWKSTDIS